MNDIFFVVLDCVRNLLRISILIQKATPRDRFRMAIQKSQYRFDDSFDIGHVAEKFPKLSRPEQEWLKIRLGRAIAHRRQFIRYCREHSDKLGADDLNEHTPEAILNSDKPSRLVGNEETLSVTKTNPTATQGSTKASTLQVARLEAAKQEKGDDDNDDERSVVSTVVSGIESADETTLRLPRLQDVNQGKPVFECPFCFKLQNWKQERKWR